MSQTVITKIQMFILMQNTHESPKCVVSFILFYTKINLHILHIKYKYVTIIFEDAFIIAPTVIKMCYSL